MQGEYTLAPGVNTTCLALPWRWPPDRAGAWCWKGLAQVCSVRDCSWKGSQECVCVYVYTCTQVHLHL